MRDDDSGETFIPLARSRREALARATAESVEEVFGPRVLRRTGPDTPNGRGPLTVDPKHQRYLHDGPALVHGVHYTIGDRYTWCWVHGMVRGEHDCTEEG